MGKSSLPGASGEVGLRVGRSSLRPGSGPFYTLFGTNEITSNLFGPVSSARNKPSIRRSDLFDRSFSLLRGMGGLIGERDRSQNLMDSMTLLPNSTCHTRNCNESGLWMVGSKGQLSFALSIAGGHAKAAPTTRRRCCVAQQCITKSVCTVIVGRPLSTCSP